MENPKPPDTAMAKTAPSAPMVYGHTREQVELIKATVAKGATDDELGLFLTVAKRSGLDPFSKQIHFIKRKQKVRGTKDQWEEVGTIQTGIDGFRAIAVKSKALAGIGDAVFDRETGANPAKATVTVKRLLENGAIAEFTATARWAEYAQSYDGRPSGLWAKMPFTMLAKCAEALALRKAFPNDLSGLYTAEEMSQADREEAPQAPKVPLMPPPPSPQQVALRKRKAILDCLVELGVAFDASAGREENTRVAHEAIKSKTSLDLTDDNLDEVLARLAVVVDEAKEARRVAAEQKAARDAAQAQPQSSETAPGEAKATAEAPVVTPATPAPAAANVAPSATYPTGPNPEDIPF